METFLKNIKIFKGGIIALLLGLLLSGGSVSSQSLKGNWQLQNPDIFSDCVVWSFNDDGTFVCTAISLTTNEQSFNKGTYRLHYDTLFLFNSGQNSSCIISRPTPKKLLINLSDKIYDFSSKGSVYDKFLRNYKISMGEDVDRDYGVSSYAPGRDTSSQNKDQLCWCCRGMGKCSICFGKGQISTSPPMTCMNCDGTGKCKHCNNIGHSIRK